VPAVIVPAIIPCAEEELDLFHIAWTRRNETQRVMR
jgi:hypothetical protein